MRVRATTVHTQTWQIMRVAREAQLDQRVGIEMMAWPSMSRIANGAARKIVTVVRSPEARETGQTPVSTLTRTRTMGSLYAKDRED